MSIKNPKIEKELKEALGIKQKPVLEVGFFQEAKYPDGSFMASIASKNEFGNSWIPPRPFFRNAISNEEEKWGELILKFFKNAKAEQALGMLGEVVRVDIVKSIDKTNTPPNSPVTIARKGSSKPLVDTGLMRSSVSFQVRSENESRK